MTAISLTLLCVYGFVEDATCANWQVPVAGCTTGRLQFLLKIPSCWGKNTKLPQNTTICRHFVASAKPIDMGKTKSPSKWLKNHMSTSPRSMSATVRSWERWNFCFCLRSEAARTRLIWRRNQKWGWSTVELRSPYSDWTEIFSKLTVTVELHKEKGRKNTH